MRDLVTVTKFTMKDMLHRKSYIVSTIIILIMIIVGFNIPNIIKSFSSETVKQKIIISDIDNVYSNNLDNINTILEDYEITVNKDTVDTIKEKIINEEAEQGIVVTKENDIIKYTFVIENTTFYEGPDEVLMNSLTSLYRALEIDKLGLSEQELKAINPEFDYGVVEAGQEAKGNPFAMMLMSIALFYAIYFSVYQVSSSITTEKTSKIIETLVTSTEPKYIVLGKTIGIGLVGLMQLLF